MNNEWVSPQVGALNLDNHEILDGQSSLPFLSVCLEPLMNLCQFLPFPFGAAEMKKNFGVEVADLET